MLTRARGAQVIAASIAILPPDSLAEVVKYIVTWETRSDVLALRCASKFCRHAVRRGIAGYSATSGADQIEYVQFPVPDHRKTIKYHLSERDARRIEARGIVFGHRCRTLTFSWGTAKKAEGPAAVAVVNSIRSFVTDTNCGLKSICLSGSTISPDVFLEICRWSPRLTELIVGDEPHLECTSYLHMDGFLAAVSQACPSLEKVTLGGYPKESLHRYKSGASPAESCAMHFPNLKTLSFCGRTDVTVRYRPEDLTRIEQSAERCRATTCDLGFCYVSQTLVATLLRTSLPSRLRRLELDYADVDAQMILQIAAASPGLRELTMVSAAADDASVREKSPAFFESLWRARPELKQLEVALHGQEMQTNDLCLESIAKFSLKKLRIVDGVRAKFTTAGIDALLSGPCSKTLECFNGCDASLPMSELARLVQGCPKLRDLFLAGYKEEEKAEGTAAPWNRLAGIFRSRGGVFVNGSLSDDDDPPDY